MSFCRNCGTELRAPSIAEIRDGAQVCDACGHSDTPTMTMFDVMEYFQDAISQLEQRMAAMSAVKEIPHD